MRPLEAAAHALHSRRSTSAGTAAEQTRTCRPCLTAQPREQAATHPHTRQGRRPLPCRPCRVRLRPRRRTGARPWCCRTGRAPRCTTCRGASTWTLPPASPSTRSATATQGGWPRSLSRRASSRTPATSTTPRPRCAATGWGAQGGPGAGGGASSPARRVLADTHDLVSSCTCLASFTWHPRPLCAAPWCRVLQPRERVSGLVAAWHPWAHAPTHPRACGVCRWSWPSGWSRAPLPTRCSSATRAPRPTRAPSSLRASGRASRCDEGGTRGTLGGAH